MRTIGLDRDARRIVVALFADHDDIRILSQQASEHRSQRQADPFIRLKRIDQIEVNSTGSSTVRTFFSIVATLFISVGANSVVAPLNFGRCRGFDVPSPQLIMEIRGITL